MGINKDIKYGFDGGAKGAWGAGVAHHLIKNLGKNMIPSKF